MWRGVRVVVGPHLLLSGIEWCLPCCGKVALSLVLAGGHEGGGKLLSCV